MLWQETILLFKSYIIWGRLSGCTTLGLVLGSGAAPVLVLGVGLDVLLKLLLELSELSDGALNQ